MLCGLAILIRVLLLNVLCVRDHCLGKIRGFPEFPGYFAPYIRGGTRVAVFHAGGGSNIIIQYRGIIFVGYKEWVNPCKYSPAVIYYKLGNT